MAGIQGLGGIPEPAPERPVTSRDRRRDDAAAPTASADDVLISSEAQAAAKISSYVQSAQQDTIRQDRVDQARQAIENGDYKKQDVVSEIAKRLSKIL